MRYRNRTEAGQVLAQHLLKYAGRDDILVLALPRGGVPVGYEVAIALDAPLDVFVVRKLGVPGHEELALGAVATGDVRVLNYDVVRGLAISNDMIEVVTAREMREVKRLERAFRDDRPPQPITGQIVILVDDGLATGSTMRAAAEAIRKQNPARLIVAVPVGAAETGAEFEQEADEAICAQTPDPFWGVGLWYEDFSQTPDDQVRQLLARAAEGRSAAHPEATTPSGR